MALRACSISAIERKAPRLQFGNIKAAIGTRHGRGVKLLLSAGDPDEDQTVGHLHRLRDGSFQPLLRARFEDDAVDDCFNGVVFAPLEPDRVGKVPQFAVDTRAEALLVKGVQQFAELAFAAADDGRVDGGALARGRA